MAAARAAVEAKLHGRKVTWCEAPHARKALSCVCADTACATNGGRTPIQGNKPYLDWLDAETKPPKKEL